MMIWLPEITIDRMIKIRICIGGLKEERGSKLKQEPDG